MFGSCQKAKKNIEHEGYGDTNGSWSAWSNLQSLEWWNKYTRGIGI